MVCNLLQKIRDFFLWKSITVETPIVLGSTQWMNKVMKQLPDSHGEITLANGEFVCLYQNVSIISECTIPILIQKLARNVVQDLVRNRREVC